MENVFVVVGIGSPFTSKKNGNNYQVIHAVATSSLFRGEGHAVETWFLDPSNVPSNLKVDSTVRVIYNNRGMVSNLEIME